MKVVKETGHMLCACIDWGIPLNVLKRQAMVEKDPFDLEIDDC